MVAMTYRLLRTDSMHCNQRTEAESRVIANRFDTTGSERPGVRVHRAGPAGPRALRLGGYASSRVMEVKAHRFATHDQSVEAEPGTPCAGHAAVPVCTT